MLEINKHNEVESTEKGVHDMPYTKEDVAAGKAKAPGGRPNKWTDPKELEKLINAYFKQDGKKSVMGLCVWLDCGRDMLFDYQKIDRFTNVLDRARRRIMTYYEELGQEARMGHFPDRMLSRMKWPVEEAGQGLLGSGGTTIMVFGAGASEALPEAMRRQVESRVVDDDDDDAIDAPDAPDNA